MQKAPNEIKKDDYFFDRKRATMFRATADWRPGIDLLHVEIITKEGNRGVVLKAAQILAKLEHLTPAEAELASVLFLNKLN